MTLRTLNYGNYGIFLIMGNAGFCPSTVGRGFRYYCERVSVLGCVFSKDFGRLLRDCDFLSARGCWGCFIEF